MGSRTQIALTSSAPRLRVIHAMPLKLLAAALAGSVQCVVAHAANFDLKLDVMTTEEHHTVISQQCTGTVCRLPTSTPIPIPYPDITLDATDGVLRGRMRVEGDFDHAGHDTQTVELTSTVSFSNMGTISIVQGAPTVLVELGMAGITGSPSFANSSRLSVAGCSQLSGCQSHFATTTASAGVLDAAGGVVAVQQGAGGRLEDVDAGEQTVVEFATLEVPAHERFGLFWKFETLLRLNIESHAGPHYAENDFSHTLGFTGLRFYDSGHNDVTQWINVAWDSPMAFISAPVPEPETYAMLLAGLGLLGFHARRRKLTQAAAA